MRMYVGARETLRGWRKNTSAGLGEGSLAAASALAAAGIVSAVAPAVALVRGHRWAGLAGLALQLAARASSDEVSPTPRRHWLLFRQARSPSRCCPWSAPRIGCAAASCGGAAVTMPAPITGSAAIHETRESRRGEGCAGRSCVRVRRGRASQSLRLRPASHRRPPSGGTRILEGRPSLPVPPPSAGGRAGPGPACPRRSRSRGRG